MSKNSEISVWGIKWGRRKIAKQNAEPFECEIEQKQKETFEIIVISNVSQWSECCLCAIIFVTQKKLGKSQIRNDMRTISGRIVESFCQKLELSLREQSE